MRIVALLLLIGGCSLELRAQEADSIFVPSQIRREVGLRSKATFNSATIRRLDEGSTVVMSGEDGEFVSVRFGTEQGWVHSAYVEPADLDELRRLLQAAEAREKKRTRERLAKQQEAREAAAKRQAEIREEEHRLALSRVSTLRENPSVEVRMSVTLPTSIEAPTGRLARLSLSETGRVIGYHGDRLIVEMDGGVAGLLSLLPRDRTQPIQLEDSAVPLIDLMRSEEGSPVLLRRIEALEFRWQEEEVARIKAEEQRKLEEQRREQRRLEAQLRQERVQERAEEQRMVEEQRRQQRAQELLDRGIPIEIHSWRFSVNSAGGVEPTIIVENVSDASIKYVSLAVTPYNSVGDIVQPRYKATPVAIRLIGPIDHQESAVYSFESEPMFYATTTACIEIDRIDIEFFSGKQTVLIKDLSLARAENSGVKVKGDCAVRR